MPAFLASLGIKDFIYGTLIAGLIGFWFYHNHEEQLKGEAKVTAAVAAATTKAEAKAAAQLAATQEQYASTLAKVQATYEDQITAATAQHSSDEQRLREYDAYRQSHPDQAVGSSATAASGSDGGTASVIDLGSSLEAAALGLADALRHDDAQLQLCWDERDSLTGK